MRFKIEDMTDAKINLLRSNGYRLTGRVLDGEIYIIAKKVKA